MADEKSARMLAAAMETFGRYGFQRATMAEIAARAGISRPALYMHYRGKEELFRAVIEAHLRRALDAAEMALRRDASLLDRLLDAFDRWVGDSLELLRAMPHAQEVIEAKHRLAGDAYRRASAEFRRMLVREIREGGAETRIADFRVSPTSAADLLIDVSNGAKDTLPAATEYRKRMRVAARLVCGHRTDA